MKLLDAEANCAEKQRSKILSHCQPAETCVSVSLCLPGAQITSPTPSRASPSLSAEQHRRSIISFTSPSGSLCLFVSPSHPLPQHIFILCIQLVRHEPRWQPLQLFGGNCLESTLPHCAKLFATWLHTPNFRRQTLKRPLEGGVWCLWRETRSGRFW